MAAPSGLRRVGNTIQDATGRTIRFQGWNKSGGESMPLGGYSYWNAPMDAAQIAAFRASGANYMRLTIDAGVWLGLPGISTTYSGANFRTELDRVIALLIANDITPSIATVWGHPETAWNGGSCFTDIGDHQIPLPDAANFPTAWASIAAHYKNQTEVVFNLFGEPRHYSGSDAATWVTLRDGGYVDNDVSPQGGVTGPAQYLAVGMTSLLTTIRNTGATNFCLIPGIGYGKDLTLFTTYAPTDPINNFGATWHTYYATPWQIDPAETRAGGGSTPGWNTRIAPCAAVYPVVLDELGEMDCQGTFFNSILPWCDSHAVGYACWTWRTGGCSEPAGLSNDSPPTLTVMGQAFSNYMKAHPIAFTGGTTGGDTTAPTASITAPAAGATISGTAVTVTATASDNVAVTRVDFYAGATFLGSDAASPYTITVDSTTLPNGAAGITAKAYDAAGNVGTSAAIAVTVANGGSGTGNPQTLPGTYTVGGATLASLSPATVEQFAPATVLTVTGTGYVIGAAITWNGVALTTTLLSATQLRATIPARLLATAGSDTVTVQQGGATTGALTFAVTVPPTPTLTASSPAALLAGSGDTILTLTGTGFRAGSPVLWNGAALAVAYVSATQIKATVTAALLATVTTASLRVASQAYDAATNPAPISAALTVPVVAAPLLSAIAAAPVGAITATVTWTTDTASDSTVEYGTDAAYGQTATSATLTPSHSIALSGLLPSTTYHYRVRSKVATGQETIGTDRTFTTTADATGIGGTLVVVPPSALIAAGTVVTITATPNAGAALSRWEVDGVSVAATNPLTLTMNADHSVKVFWKAA